METSVAEPEGRGRPLSPSGLGGAKTLPGAEEDATAKARGTALHLLLQHLPGQAEGRWAMLARSLIAEPGLCEPALERAAALIRDPALAEIFAPGTLAEVPVAGMLEQAAAEGVIDRLIVGPDRVLAVDFKSNRLVPASPAEVPEAILRQMGAYRALLQPAWPGRRIETAVLWTETGALMILPDEIVRAALTRATGDGGQPLDDGPDGA
jgi:ATP-dependent helicase/nuclease subunit A